MRPDMPHEGHGPHWVNQPCPRCGWISPQKHITLSSVSCLGSQMGGGPQNTPTTCALHEQSLNTRQTRRYEEAPSSKDHEKTEGRRTGP